MRERPLLQVALDLLDLGLMREIASYASRQGFDIIEVGTPAIKRFGVDVVRDVKRHVAPGARVLADMKILDASSIEVGMAAESGAEIVTVMGFAEEETLREALDQARSRGVEVWADLMYIERPVERAAEIRRVGIDTVILHVGVDVQKRRGVSAEILEREVEAVAREGLRVAVAGGLDPYKALRLVERGASVIIIGGWIVKSERWRERVLEAVRVLKRV